MMEDAENKVRELFREVLRARSLSDDNIVVKPLSSGGANYTSALFAATQANGSSELNGIEKTNEDGLSIFAKVAIVSEKMRKAMNADTLFETEAIVYKELVEEYNKLQSERGVSIFKFPEMFACDLTRGSETLLLEDMTKSGFRVPSRHNSAEWRFAAAAIGKLAAFHALSFALEKHNPGKFQCIAERVKFKVLEEDDSSKDVWTKIIGNAVQVSRDEHKERVMKILGGMQEEYPKFRKPINKTVLIHGDYRTSNLLFKDTGEDVEIMVVDYQTVITGSPAADVLYFIFLGTNQEFRKEYYQRLLDHYYQKLTSAASMLDVDLSEVYPREMYDSEIKESTPNALRFSSIILPLVTVDEAAAPSIDGEADVSNFAISPNQAFAERFRGLVDDCVEWGML